MTNRISFFDSYSDSSGGAPKSMLALAQLLNSKGFIVSIYTSKDGSLSYQAKSHQLNSVSLNIADILLVRRNNQVKSFKFLLLYCIAIIKCWVSCFSYIPYLKGQKVCFNDIRCFLFYLPIAFIKRRDLIWYVRINDRVKFVTRIATFLSNKIILISSSCAGIFHKDEFEKIKNKVVIVHTGFPLPKQHNFIPEEKVFLGFVGVLSKRKNIELLIDSLKLLDERAQGLLSVIVVGTAKEDDKPYEREIKSLVIDSGLNKTFKFVGHANNVNEYYSKMDAVIMTSYSEGLPRVLIEGLSHGCFVITTRVDGVVDIITDDFLGVIIDDYSPKALSLAIMDYIYNREEILKKRSFRVDYIKENFSENKFVDDFIKSIL